MEPLTVNLPGCETVLIYNMYTIYPTLYVWKIVSIRYCICRYQPDVHVNVCQYMQFYKCIVFLHICLQVYLHFIYKCQHSFNRLYLSIQYLSTCPRRGVHFCNNYSLLIICPCLGFFMFSHGGKDLYMFGVASGAALCTAHAHVHFAHPINIKHGSFPFFLY
jgi:hypothetical protein